MHLGKTASKIEFLPNVKKDTAQNVAVSIRCIPFRVNVSFISLQFELTTHQLTHVIVDMRTRTANVILHIYLYLPLCFCAVYIY